MVTAISEVVVSHVDDLAELDFGAELTFARTDLLYSVPVVIVIEWPSCEHRDA